MTARWHAVESDIAVDLSVIRLCRAEPAHCPSDAARKLAALIDEAAPLAGRARIGTINRGINLLITKKNDLVAPGAEEFWAAPIQTVEEGGDCDDVAIAKFVLLGEAGLSADDLRILIVYSRLQHENHALAAVRNRGHWLLMDNRNMTLIDDRDAESYLPRFVIDHHGVREYVAHIASAKSPCSAIE